MSNNKSTQKTREILTVTPEEAESIIFEGGYGPWDKELGDDTPGYQAFKVISDEIIDHRRWTVVHKVTVQRLSDSKYFSSSYSLGATESQERGAYEYDQPTFKEVFPVEKTTIVYE